MWYVIYATCKFKISGTKVMSYLYPTPITITIITQWEVGYIRYHTHLS